MPTKPITSYILFQGAIILFASCSFVKDSGSSAFGDMSKVNRAERLYKRQDYEHAISLCNTVLNNGGNENVTRKAKLQLARIYYETRQFEKTISLYDEVLYKPGPDIAASDVTNYLDLLKRTGRVTKAKEITDQYQKDYKEDTRFKNISQSLDNYYAFFNRKVEEGTHVDSLRLNLPGYQYGLALYKENIVFLSNDVKKKDAQSLYTNSKLYILSEEGVTPFNNSLRGVLQIGPASFYDNGQKVIYTSNKFSEVRNEKNGFINTSNGTQLLFATFQAEHNSWSKPNPVYIGKNNISASILHPSVAPDGKRLYFASDMPGGFGGTDIYYTDWDATEKRWKAPVNMGPEVNTNGNELYPFISGNKLFFSSNGLEGFGGLDIFVIDINNQAKGAEHLPFPVNTQFDDLNPVLDDTKRLLYFTSDRSGVHDNDHIYVLSLANNDPLKQVGISYPDTARTSDKTSLAVIQTDNRRQETLTGDSRYDNAISNEPVKSSPAATPAATPVVVDSRTTTDYGNSAANSAPEMISWQYQAGTPEAAAAAAISKANAAPAQDRPVNSHPEQLDWQAATDGNADTKKIAVTNPDVIAWQKANHIADKKMDSIVRAANLLIRTPGIIYFDLNSYVPMDQEWKKLDSIFQLWKTHPERLILISGHTDIIGTEKYNLSLSKNRAVYIQECLKSRGVDPEKIRISYFGSTKPVWIAGGFSLDHDREMFIQLQGVNRRCEVKIL